MLEHPYSKKKKVSNTPLSQRPTPEEVARKVSMNASYYRGPHRFITLHKNPIPKRTELEQLHYMKNRYSQCSFYIRKFTKQKKDIEIIEKKRNSDIAMIKQLDSKIKYLKKKLSTIVIPDLKRK